MSGVRSGAVRKDVVRLFDGDSVAGLGEGELLHRFVTHRDEAAFEALVTTLGPMVLGVARRMLADPHDVDDAFQATFLVLIKKAGSIRDVDLVAPWLYGVALKVVRRARLESTRRQARERLASMPEGVEVEHEWPEIRAAIDEEIGRLPEAHRRAVVLCDVEGLSREEAAVRLGWTLNMVRGRLERARGRLRGRLARRGLAPSGVGMGLVVASPSLSPGLVAATIRAALAFSGGRLATGLASASAVALTQGVLRMMMLSKFKIGAVALLSTGFVVGGSGWIAAQQVGDKPGAGTAKAVAPVQEPVRQIPPAGTFQPRPAADLAKARVEVALKRYETQWTFYAEGRITIDRVMDASQNLMQAQINAAGSRAERVAAARAHYDRIKEILRREKAELEVGRAATADVAEAESTLLDAEFALARELETPEADGAEVNSSSSTSPRDPFAANPAGPGPKGGSSLPAGPGMAPTNPGRQTAKGQSPLAEAIAAFNAMGSNSDHALDPDVDPLTEGEVIANIRHWQPTGTTGGAATGAEVAAFKSIATTRRLPEGATFRLESGELYVLGDYVYFGLRVSLVLPGQSGEDFPFFSIRTRLSRSLTFEEALAEAEGDAKRRPDSIAAKARVEEYRKWIKQRQATAKESGR